PSIEEVPEEAIEDEEPGRGDKEKTPVPNPFVNKENTPKPTDTELKSGADHELPIVRAEVDVDAPVELLTVQEFEASEIMEVTESTVSRVKVDSHLMSPAPQA